jgi:hypothetical protein
VHKVPPDGRSLRGTGSAWDRAGGCSESEGMQDPEFINRLTASARAVLFTQPQMEFGFSQDPEDQAVEAIEAEGAGDAKARRYFAQRRIGSRNVL